jgi:hypothetical protein
MMNIETLKDDKLPKILNGVLFCYCLAIGIILGIS